MNLLNILTFIAAGAIGAIIGLVIEYFIDVSIVKSLQDENRRLRLENSQLRKEVKHEVIEIVDNRVGRDIDFSQRW